MDKCGAEQMSGASPEIMRELKQLRIKVKIAQDLDRILEECTKTHRDLEASVELIFDYFMKEFEPKPTGLFLRTEDEDLTWQTFTRGVEPGFLEKNLPELLKSEKNMQVSHQGQEWFVLPLDISEIFIGNMGIALPETSCHEDIFVFEALETAAEELDNYFYAIQEGRRKHMTILQVQRSLKARFLNEAIERAIEAIDDMVPMDGVFLLYIDEDIDGQKIIQYLIFRNNKKVYDSNDTPMPQLEALIKAGKQILVPGNKDLEGIFQITKATETILFDGLLDETLVGKMLVKPPKGIGFSMESREIIQVLSESLRQRLVDFNREKNRLREFFSPEITRRLLKVPDYRQKHLSPRKAEIGIMYADICGFTKLSEQVLKEPERVAWFIDAWSKGIVEQIFPHGGILDKIVGDCVITLFGPPFYDVAPGDIAIRCLKSAMAVRKFTMEFLAAPQNKEVQDSPYFKDFGVAIGINFCPATVGMIGPNQDLTAFSSGMNNAARLQGQAKRNEIFVFPQLKELADQVEPWVWQFDGPHAVQVKNVKDPLQYYKLLNE